MDGVNYSDCDVPFKIYSNEINLTSMNPKSGSVSGGSEATIFIDLDSVTASCIQNLIVGFQPRNKKGSGGNNQMSRNSLNDSSNKGSSQ